PAPVSLPVQTFAQSRAAMLRTSFLLPLLVLLLPLAAQAEFKQGAPTVLITGANRGIGLELARQYADKGWNVIATSRHVTGDAALAALADVAAKHPQVVLEKIDVSDSATVRSVAGKYSQQPIDVVINNA